MSPPSTLPDTSLPIAQVDRLPPELLIEIFAFCSQDVDHAFTPILLGAVCRLWRDIVYGACRVWQHLYLNDIRNPLVSRSQAILWLQHCHPLPLNVHVHLALDADMLLLLLSPILSHLDLWGSCSITGALQEEFQFPDLEGTKGHLTQLQIVVKGVGAVLHDLDEGDPIPTFHSFLPILPGNSHDVFMRVAVTAIPEPHLMSRLHVISSLTITEYSLAVSTDAPRMLEFLKELPMLKSFNFFGWPHEGNSQADDAPQPPVVTLLHLRTLLIRSTCAVRTLLSHIHAPLLTELYLEHTNIDFELLHDPYAHAAEDGDSEDESHDFSQSPWSDHATGMGLRSLVRRSRPPLLVLEMDYADMRTKDFLWCFDRLEQLREFRIVASDMSNTVIRMLAPFRDEVHLPHPGVEAPLRVRLPHLTSLELWHCQRLSGDAIVATLHERVAFTDAAAASGGEVETLEDVAVVECSDFLFHHAVKLSPVLGNRLRIS